MHECCVCRKLFQTQNALEHHQRVKKHGDLEECFCGKLFTTQQRLEQHIDTAHNWICPQCNKKYPTLTEFCKHRQARGHCYCHHCHRFFVSVLEYDEHYNAAHIHVRGRGKTRYSTEKALERRLTARHHCYCCPCERYFFDSHALDQHTAAVHKFLCSQCDQQFLNRRDLADHQYALGHYYYAQRNELFADEQALAQHKVSVHTFDSSTTTNLETDQQVTSHWYCQICDRHFSDRDALKQHEVTVHSLICKQCDAEFVTQSSLKLHQIAKEHCYCQRCDLMFRENFTHQQHKLTAHTYRCDQCGEVCQSINLLEDHRKTTGHLFCQECDHFSKDKASHKPDLVPAPIDSEHDRRTEVTQEASEEAASSQPISHKLCNEDKQSQIPLVTLTFSTLGIKCISGNKCDEYFLSPVAAYQHIESGACKSGISEGRQATILQQFSEVFTASSRLAGSATPLDNLASVPAAPEQTRKMQEVASAPRVSTRSPEPSGKVSLLSRTVLGSGTPSSLESVFRSAIQNRPVTPLELETTVMRETKPNVVRGKGSSINSKSSTTSTPLHFTHNQ